MRLSGYRLIGFADWLIVTGTTKGYNAGSVPKKPINMQAAFNVL